ncbi:MAG: LuxR C-terminal-related transcriptional regulator [Streptosporangiaceae bacterium]
MRDQQLVTLTGVGGVGKTRMALEVGAELAGEFPDGAWMVELAAVGDPGSIPAAIATVLGITPQGDTSLITTVAAALAGKRLLLVIDNCEHLLRAAGSAIEAIVGRSGHIRVLATSREPLGVDAEAVLGVSPLEVAGGTESDAVTLFMDRARAVRRDFGLGDPDTAAAVTEICTTLDGLPLGIELAAARMAAMSAIEVRDRLADRFRLLQGSMPGPERQHTLRHTVGWSYDLLTDDERELLRATSVFAGGFELASIHAVATCSDVIDVLRHLDSLVRKSLVVADHTTTHTRYSLFETIRQFAEDRLEAAGELTATRDRHAAYFAGQASDRFDRWNGPGWRDAVDWVDAEFGNLRAAFRWSSARGEVAVATDIAAHAALMGFSVQLFETLAWAEELLPAASAADVSRLPRLFTGAGLACFAGRAEAARANAHRAVELEVDARYDPCEPGYAMFIEALCQVYCGDLERYIELTGEVVESSSFHHVPELAELGDRLTSRLGATKAGELIAVGTGLDLDAAAVYARGQIDAARRDPRPGPRGARPGGLSRREIDVLRLLAAGRTSGEIATELFISSRTAEHHIQNIYTKIGVSNRAAATRWAMAHRVVDDVPHG